MAGCRSGNLVGHVSCSKGTDRSVSNRQHHPVVPEPDCCEGFDHRRGCSVEHLASGFSMHSLLRNLGHPVHKTLIHSHRHVQLVEL